MIPRIRWMVIVCLSVCRRSEGRKLHVHAPIAALFIINVIIFYYFHFYFISLVVFIIIIFILYNYNSYSQVWQPGSTGQLPRKWQHLAQVMLCSINQEAVTLVLGNTWFSYPKIGKTWLRVRVSSSVTNGNTWLRQHLVQKQLVKLLSRQ